MQTKTDNAGKVNEICSALWLATFVDKMGLSCPLGLPTVSCKKKDDLY